MPSPRTARATGPNLRERFDAMRNLAPFLRQIWQTSRTLTIASLGLRVVRALMPVATLYIGKLIIDEAIRLVGLGLDFGSLGDAWRSGQLDTLLGHIEFNKTGDMTIAPMYLYEVQGSEFKMKASNQ